MPDGLFIDGKRPASKRAVREAIADDPKRIDVEYVALGRERVVSLDQAEAVVTFVGPDPHTKRNFYGTIKRTPSGYKVA